MAIWLVSSISSLVFLLVDDARHWALIPVTLVGWLLVAEVIRAVRAREDWLAPRTVVAAFSVYFFYAVPILHLGLDHWLKFIPSPADWRAALGVSAWVNLVGVTIYLCAVSLKAKGVGGRKAINMLRLRALLLAGVALGILVWFFVAVQFGGPKEYLNSLLQETANLSGYGIFLVAAEAWPSLVLVVVLVFNRGLLAQRPRLLVLVFLGFISLQFFAGGLRGSRAIIVWPLVIGLTISHLLVRRIRFRSFMAIAITVFVFAWVYAFYKSAGAGVTDLFLGEVSASQLSATTGRSMAQLLTEDFGRSGVQALIVDHVLGGWRPTLGETYAGNVQLFLPDSLIWHSFRTKTQVATEMFYGMPVENLDGFLSSRILGLGGEALINFGLPGILIVYAVFGRLVASWNSAYVRALRNPQEVGWCLVAGVYPALAILTLISDMDNVILFCLKYVLPILLAVWLATQNGSRLSDPGKSNRVASS